MVLSETEALELTFQFEAIFEAFPDILFRLTREGEIVYCKAGKTMKTRIVADEFSGKNIKELLNDSADKKFKSAIKKLRKAGDVTSLDFHYYLHGKQLWFEARLVPFYKNEIIAIVRDITEKKEAEQRLKESECIYRSIARNIPDISVFVFNRKEKLLLAEGRHIAITRKGKISTEGAYMYDAFPNDFYSAIRPYIQETLRGATRSLEMIAPAHNETSLLTFCPLQNSPENITGGILIFTSLAQKREKSFEREEKLAELRKINEQLTYEITMHKATDHNLGLYATELQRKNKELENFGYIATHDLQEPLRMVSVYSKLLQKRYKDKLDATASEFINFAVEGANRMRKMILDLRDYTDIDKSNRFSTNISAEYLLRCAMHSLKEEIDNSKAWIFFDELPEIKGDQKQLQLLMEHLLSNAIKFVKTGQKPEVHFSSEDKGDHWLFYVKDNGIGIDMRYKERIFYIFQRLNIREKFEGTGIGLAICRKVLENHNGHIWLESEPGKGSTFIFSLPK